MKTLLVLRFCLNCSSLSTEVDSGDGMWRFVRSGSEPLVDW